MRSGQGAACAYLGRAPKEVEMPDASSKDPKSARSFAELVRELPAQTDTTTLVGVLTPSPKEGHFRLTPHAGGEPLELPVDAVRSHSVLHHEHGQLLVQLETDRAKVLPLLEEYNLLGGTRTYLTGYTWVSDHHLIQKAFADPQEREQAELKFSHSDKLPAKDIRSANFWEKDPISDLHKYRKDPIQDSFLPQEAYRPMPPGDPAGQSGAGLAPFVLATPHHAPAAPLAMQAAGLRQQGAAIFSLKEAHSDGYSDVTLKEVTQDHTLKETYKDPILDVKQANADGTFVEPGGTLAEGGGAFGPGGINQF
jgi:hypothetical protein